MTRPAYHFIEGVAAPISPSSHAVEIDGWVFMTGQIGRDMDNPDAELPNGIEAQTERTIDNMKRVLSHFGIGLENIASVRVFLARFDKDYTSMNRVYAGMFGNSKPARTCVGVTHIARDALVEIDCIARRG